jgi:CelD/BcsL family acetyltransferase involved in cellulose biosynthesis
MAVAHKGDGDLCSHFHIEPAETAQHMIHVEEINQIEQLDNYRLHWNALLPQTRNATFFQSLDWLTVYWDHYGEDQHLRVLVVLDDEKVLGILPMVVRRESSKLGSVRVLTYPLDDWSSFYGPIGPNPTATLLAGMRHINATPRDYDILDIRWVDVNDCDHGRTRTAMQQAGFDPCQQHLETSAVVDIDGNWQEYWNSRNKKWRDDIARCERRMAEAGKVELVRYRPTGTLNDDDDPRWDLYDACVKLAARSWQGSSTDGTTLSHACVCCYLRDTHLAAVRAGTLDLNILLLDGEPIAFAYNYHYNGRVYGMRKGFDPRYSRLSPGMVLQKMILEDSFSCEDTYYDMGVKFMDSKQHWITSSRESHRLTHYPSVMGRAQLIRLKRWLSNRFVSGQLSTGT